MVTGLLYKEILAEYAWAQLKRKGLYFQHDGASVHYTATAREWLDEKFPDCWSGRCGSFDLAARSPDLMPCDFFL
jgi:hypothetical protein